jgi:hypothetical protein
LMEPRFARNNRRGIRPSLRGAAVLFRFVHGVAS